MKRRILGAVLNSKPSYWLIKWLVSFYLIRPLQNPTNENVLKSAIRAKKIMHTFIKDSGLRIVEDMAFNKLLDEFEWAVKTGRDTNLTRKIKRIFGCTSLKAKQSFIVDFVIMGCVIRRLKYPQGKSLMEEFAIQINSACNKKVRCRGCFAEKDEGELDFQTQVRLVKEALALGARFVLIFGGEPLLRKKNLYRLFRKFKNVPFILATNGMALDEACAKELARLGNVIVLINIPGLKETAEVIGGPNSWDYIKKAAKNLKAHAVPSGFLSTVYEDNFRELSSSEFAQQMIDFGMIVGIFFGYDSPVGYSPITEHMLTSEAGKEFAQRIKRTSDTCPIPLLDTTNGAAEKINGCPAARKSTVYYVQSNGNLRTCPMDSQQDNGLNIHKKSLRGIIEDSPYFKLLRQEKPPCVKSPEFLKKVEALRGE